MLTACLGSEETNDTFPARYTEYVFKKKIKILSINSILIIEKKEL